MQDQKRILIFVNFYSIVEILLLNYFLHFVNEKILLKLVAGDGFEPPTFRL